MAGEEIAHADPFAEWQSRAGFEVAPAPVIALGQLAPYRYAFDDGSKYPGGFGVTELLLTDYWTLRKRSSQLYEKNLYARGLIRRLVTNEINIGLHLEATPEEAILGLQEDALADWTELTENRFALWADNPKLCDQNERLTFGQIQELARTEALVAGDVLVVLRLDQRTGLPRVQLINGGSIQSPLGADQASGNKITHGVELDSSGRHVAFHVRQDDGSSKRLPAFGEKSGRRLAWLLYGTDKRLDDVRGKPLLALVLQALQEVDRFRDSTQRKAWLLATLAIWVKKGDPGITSSRPLTRVGVGGKTEIANSDGGSSPKRRFNTVEYVPGAVVDELNQGEEPQAFQTNGTVESFGVFEEAIIQGIAWGHEIPPEILTLSFNSNYSASQAAINEFKMYLNKVRTWFGGGFCQPVYVEWLLAETLTGKIQAASLLEAWRDSSQYDTFAAWISSDWSGQIKPAVDQSKLVGGYDAMIRLGAITLDRTSRELTGMKFSKNVKKLKRELATLAEALGPLSELEAAKKAPSGNDAGTADAEGQGEDGKADKIEGSGGYPRRRALELLAPGTVKQRGLYTRV